CVAWTSDRKTVSVLSTAHPTPAALPVDARRARPVISAPLTGRARDALRRKTPMPEGYCVKCKAKKEIADGVEETMKNGRKAIKGKCPTCGTVMFKILGGKAGPVPGASGSSASTPTPPASTPPA